MAPDVFRQQCRSEVSPINIERFCVVRKPADRYNSDINWIGAKSDKFNFTLSPDEIRGAFMKGRFAVSKWTEELLHKQPQSYFVWSASGDVQCDCVVAFEKLPKLTKAHLQTSNGKPLSENPIRGQPGYSKPLPRSLLGLYELDFLLWKHALADTHLCYRPPPRAQFEKITSSSRQDLVA
jgi:hypothetical protein